MEGATDNRWAFWVKGLLRKQSDALTRAVGDAIGRNNKATQAALDRRDARIAQLEARIVQLEDAATKP